MRRRGEYLIVIIVLVFAVVFYFSSDILLAPSTTQIQHTGSLPKAIKDIEQTRVCLAGEQACGGFTDLICTPGTACVSGCCKSISCTDTDGGTNYEMQGNVTLRVGNQVLESQLDYCSGGNMLNELACGNGAIIVIGHLCESGVCNGGVCVDVQVERVIEREMPQAVSTGELVSISLNILSQRNYLVLEESFPAGWSVINSGGLDNRTGVVLKHVDFDGVQDGTITYVVQAPSEPGTYEFSGRYKTDDMPVARYIEGPGTIEVQ